MQTSPNVFGPKTECKHPEIKDDFGRIRRTSVADVQLMMQVRSINSPVCVYSLTYSHPTRLEGTHMYIRSSNSFKKKVSILAMSAMSLILSRSKLQRSRFRWTHNMKYPTQAQNTKQFHIFQTHMCAILQLAR